MWSTEPFNPSESSHAIAKHDQEPVPSSNVYLGYAKEYFPTCRACVLGQTGEQIDHRLNDKLTSSSELRVDDFSDYIHSHDAVDVIEVIDDELQPKRFRLRSNGSTFGPISKKMFIDAMKANHITDISLNHSPIDSFDHSMWLLMKNVTHLSLVGCYLNIVPDELKLFTNLHALNLSYNQIRSIPEWLGSFSYLKSLILDGNRLTSLHDTICDLINLEYLTIGSNEISYLPKKFGQLIKLKAFDASFNKLNELPDSFDSLNSLEIIELGRNKIQKMPKSLAGLSNLIILDLSDNDLEKLPKSVGFSGTIKNIYLDNNCLYDFPEWFNDLPNLVRLTCRCNQLQGEALSPDFLSNSKNLQELNFNGNLINILPKTFSSFDKLVFLELGSPLMFPERRPDLKNGNRLKKLPVQFGLYLSNLMELRLDENDLHVLPEHFGTGLVNLQKLNLHHNHLTQLPDSFCSMKKLEECILSYNGLDELPENLGDLVNLKLLKLDCNKLYKLPHSFSKLCNLVNLDLYANRFGDYPQELSKLEKIKYIGIEFRDSESDEGLTVADGQTIDTKCAADFIDIDTDVNW